MPELVLNALPIGDTWRPIGTHARRGVYAEDFQCSADLWGSLDASFLLKRTPRVRWPDLDAWSNIEAYLDNQLAWSGRVLGTPGADDDGEQIQVNAQGWQAHTDDRPFSKTFVHAATSAWVDMRQMPTSDLTRFKASGQVGTSAQGAPDANTSGSLITLSWPAGAIVAGSGNDLVGVMLDLGPSSLAKRVVISWERLGAVSAGHTVAIWGGDTVAGIITENPISFNLGSIASGTNAGTFTTARRYVLFLMQWTGVAATFTDANYAGVRATSIQVFADTAYESGNASILKASTVVTDALSRLVAINSTTGYITASSFSIPAFSADQQTPRDVINAANSFQDWQASVLPVSPDGIAAPTLRYRAKPTSPMYALTDQSAFSDASSGAIDQVYNEVTYKGTAPDGTPVLVTRTTIAAGLPLTIPDRRGVVKGFTIESSAPLTATAAQQLCDVFLSQHNTMPFKGSVSASNRRAVQITPSGVNVPPWMLLRAPGELMSFRQLKNPDTGALGREGRVAKVTYTHTTDSAAIDIDSTAGSFDALSARLAVTQPGAR